MLGVNFLRAVTNQIPIYPLTYSCQKLYEKLKRYNDIAPTMHVKQFY